MAYLTKGLANANSRAMATPIRKAASIRPAKMNILVCRLFINSGWRAEDSRNLPPISAIPIEAPMAPKPTMMPQAIANIGEAKIEKDLAQEEKQHLSNMMRTREELIKKISDMKKELAEKCH